MFKIYQSKLTMPYELQCWNQVGKEATAIQPKM